MRRPLLLAHRGFSGQYPENSPLAFQMAVEKTCVDGIESDVHISKDGKLIVFHDASVERTSNGTGFIRDMTYDDLRTGGFRIVGLRRSLTRYVRNRIKKS